MNGTNLRRRHIVKKLTGLWVILLATACATTEKVDDDLAAYLGKHINDVREELGRQSSIHNMQDGTWQYLWTERRKNYTGVGTSLMGIPLSTSSRYECTRILVVDKNKVVVDYGTEGDCH